MRILALETSGASGTVAVADGDRLLAESYLPGQRRSTQALAPTMRALLSQVGWKPSDVELVALSIGPGSFTGLRLSVATAKLFAYATGAAVRGVDTMRAIAAQAAPSGEALDVVLDAGRGELLVGHFRFATDGLPIQIGGTRLVAAADWLQEDRSKGLLIGGGLSIIGDRLPAEVKMSPRECWLPRAATIARLARQDVLRGLVGDIWTLAPAYYRRSAAEEAWDAKRRQQ